MDSLIPPVPEEPPPPQAESAPPQIHFFTPRALGLWTAFTGPMTGLLMLARNYRAFGQPKKSWPIILIGMLATVFMLLLNILVPALSHGLDHILGGFVFYHFAKAAFAKQMGENPQSAAKGGEQVSLAIAGFALFLVLSFVAGVSEVFVPDNIAQRARFGSNTVSYRLGGERSDAEGVGAALSKAGLFTASSEISAVLKKKDEAWTVELSPALDETQPDIVATLARVAPAIAEGTGLHVSVVNCSDFFSCD